MTARVMRLSPEIVARVPPFSGEAGRLAGRSDRPEEADYAAAADHVLVGAPETGEVWVFAYGSLIWNPEFDFDQERLGRVAGWHRSFCLGWVRIYRGTPERPGLMLALDHGGSCKGVVFRLPPERMRENLLKILRREMPLKWERISVRWITVQTAEGPVRAIVFPADRRKDSYLSGVPEDLVVEALATAAGERGSMAEYLASTIAHLEERGIHDRYLWQMQEAVAARIEAGPPGPSAALLAAAQGAAR